MSVSRHLLLPHQGNEAGPKLPIKCDVKWNPFGARLLWLLSALLVDALANVASWGPKRCTPQIMGVDQERDKAEGKAYGRQPDSFSTWMCCIFLVLQIV